eukprot:6698265-Alexandrium_andersonii.AAC.1
MASAASSEGGKNMTAEKGSNKRKAETPGARHRPELQGQLRAWGNALDVDRHPSGLEQRPGQRAM